MQTDSSFTRICSRCQVQQPVENFYRYPSGKMRSYCRVCAREYDRGRGKGYTQSGRPRDEQRRSTRRERRRTDNRKYYREQRQKVITALGGCCVRCNFTDARALQIDHVNGGGVTELRSVPNKQYLKAVLTSVEAGEHKYQLLCANCNWIKRQEENENPYQGE